MKKLTLVKFKKVLDILIDINEEDLISLHLSNYQNVIIDSSIKDKHEIIPDIKKIKAKFQKAYIKNKFLEDLVNDNQKLEDARIVCSHNDFNNLQNYVQQGSFIKIKKILSQYKNWSFLENPIHDDKFKGLSLLHFLCTPPLGINDYKNNFKDCIKEYKAQDEVIKSAIQKKLNFQKCDPWFNLCPVDMAILNSNSNLLDKNPSLIKNYNAHNISSVVSECWGAFENFYSFDLEHVLQKFKFLNSSQVLSPLSILLFQGMFDDRNNIVEYQQNNISNEKDILINIVKQRPDFLLHVNPSGGNIFMLEIVSSRLVSQSDLLQILYTDENAALSYLNKKSLNRSPKWMSMTIKELQNIPDKFHQKLAINEDNMREFFKNKDKSVFFEKILLKKQTNGLIKRGIKTL